MAGRGRGRGFRMSFGGFDSERREIPQTQTPNQPNPLYPVMSQKPLPLVGGDSVEYLLALKQELRGAARSSNHYITACNKRRDIQRYSDKYQSEVDPNQDFRPDWSMFPKELRIRSQKPRPSGGKAKPAPGQTVKKLGSKPEKADKSEKSEKSELLLKLETLEQKEKVSEAEEEEEEEKKAEDEEAEEEPLDEDEFEEETDYIMSYFDNGEEFGADSDDNMDEAIY